MASLADELGLSPGEPLSDTQQPSLADELEFGEGYSDHDELDLERELEELGDELGDDLGDLERDLGHDLGHDLERDLGDNLERDGHDLDPDLDVDQLDPHDELDLEHLGDTREGWAEENGTRTPRTPRDSRDSPSRDGSGTGTGSETAPTTGTGTPRRIPPTAEDISIAVLLETIEAGASLVMRLRRVDGVGGGGGLGVEERIGALIERIGEGERMREEQGRVLGGMLKVLEGEGEVNGHLPGMLESVSESPESPTGPTPDSPSLQLLSTPLTTTTQDLIATLQSLGDTTSLSLQTSAGLARTTRGIRLSLADARRREAEEVSCRRAVEVFENQVAEGRRVDVRREMGEVVEGFRGVLEDAERKLGLLGGVR